MVGIGREIEKVVREKRMPVKELAKKISTNRNNVYNIFKRDTIDTGLLEKIGKVLDYNFFGYYFSEEEIIRKVSDNNIAYTRLKDLPLLLKKIEQLESEVLMLKERLHDKDMIIALMRETREKTGKQQGS